MNYKTIDYNRVIQEIQAQRGVSYKSAQGYALGIFKQFKKTGYKEEAKYREVYYYLTEPVREGQRQPVSVISYSKEYGITGDDLTRAFDVDRFESFTNKYGSQVVDKMPVLDENGQIKKDSAGNVITQDVTLSEAMNAYSVGMYDHDQIVKFVESVKKETGKYREK